MAAARGMVAGHTAGALHECRAEPSATPAPPRTPLPPLRTLAAFGSEGSPAAPTTVIQTPASPDPGLCLSLYPPVKSALQPFSSDCLCRCACLTRAPCPADARDELATWPSFHSSSGRHVRLPFRLAVKELATAVLPTICACVPACARHTTIPQRPPGVASACRCGPVSAGQ